MLTVYSSKRGANRGSQMESSRWNVFRAECVDAMEKIDRNDVTMFQAYQLLHKYDDDDDPDEVILFIQTTNSEIGADHDGYLELLSMLKAEVT
jgi:hypothetical protein